MGYSDKTYIFLTVGEYLVEFVAKLSQWSCTCGDGLEMAGLGCDSQEETLQSSCLGLPTHRGL